MTTPVLKRAVWPFVYAAFFLLVGCNESKSVTRYDLTGKVTYKGNPVPAGRILLSPDTEKGNSGPAGVADITAGVYKTRPNRGVVGGPHVVTIYGEDGTEATETRDNALFVPYQMEIDIPREKDVSLEFDVPEH